MMNTDRIEREILLRAPRSRVWRALTEGQEFGSWFGVRLGAGDFQPGARVSGPLTYKGLDHVTMKFTVEQVEPESFFSYRWHPYAVDPDYDYEQEPTTLVEFRLDEVDGGTRLRVVESGFDLIPEARKAKALEMNSNGWAIQMENIERHVSAVESRG